MGKLQINIFNTVELNDLAVRIIQRNKKSSEHIIQAYKEYKSALLQHWANGKDVYDNYDSIIEECETQERFAEKVGLTPQQLSNDLRAYKALLGQGVETAEDVEKHLRDKGIRPTVKNWEKLPRLLNQPKEQNKKEDVRQKDERRLEDLYDEIEEIQQRNKSNPNITQEAGHLKQHIVDLTTELLKEDPTNLEWESKAYLDFVRGYGMDILTGESVSPDTRLEPHHVNPFTGHAGGGVANKVPDCFTIPLTKKNHRDIHDGTVHYTKEEYLKAVVTIQSHFIMTYGS